MDLPEGSPTWLVLLLTVIGTLAGSQGLKPLWGWIGKRLEADRQQRALERGDLVAQLQEQLRTAHESEQQRAEENVALRLELAQEREQRMTFARDCAVLSERIDNLTKAMAEDKRDCDAAIRRLTAETRRLNERIVELSRQLGGRQP